MQNTLWNSRLPTGSVEQIFIGEQCQFRSNFTIIDLPLKWPQKKKESENVVRSSCLLHIS